MIAIDLSKQQALDADRRTTQQINLTANSDCGDHKRIFIILDEAKETVFTRNCKSIVNMS